MSLGRFFEKKREKKFRLGNFSEDKKNFIWAIFWEKTCLSNQQDAIRKDFRLSIVQVQAKKNMRSHKNTCYSTLIKL